MIRIFLIPLLFLLSFNLNAQDEFYKSFLEANRSYTADLNFVVFTIQDSKESLKGKIIVSNEYTYTKLSNTEFYNFDNYQIKVVNPEKKILLSKSNHPVSGFKSFFGLDFKTLDFFYFLKTPIKTNEGYSFELIPIDNMSQYLNRMIIKTDTNKVIKEVTTFFSKFNYYGLDKILYKLSNHNELTGEELKPSDFFETDIDGSLELLNKYKSYQIIQMPNEK